MSRLFQNVLTASFHGSIVIGVVLLLRPLLRKAPRKFVCMLWLMAGLRLLIPLEISSPVSLQPASAAQVRTEIYQQVSEYTGFEMPAFLAPDLRGREPEADRQTQTRQPAQSRPEAQSPVQEVSKAPIVIDWEKLAAWAWLAVMGAIALWSLGSYLYLRLRIREAIRIREGIWESDRIGTAFILGYLKPRIYLPMGLSRANRRHILAHERTHLEKGDHWFKLVGFLALAVHWFNPLVWIAYVLLCRDIEMACDERVVQFMEMEDRKSYSAALVACSAGRAHYAVCPVAFGEVSVKERVRRVLHYRRPGFWISLAAVAALAFVAVCFLTSPKGENPLPTETIGVMETTQTGEPAETRPGMEAAPGHDLSDLPETVREEEEYVDPNGHHLMLRGNTVGMGLYFDRGISFDDARELGRTTTVTDEYWVEKWNGSSWEKLTPAQEPVWFGVTYNLEDGGWSTRTDVQALYGQLYDGQYRIGKIVNVAGEEYTYYGEFTRYINDPEKEPEAAAARDRINAAIDEAAGRELVHVVGYTNWTNETSSGKDEWEVIAAGEDYLSTGKSQETRYSSGETYSNVTQTARRDGVSYVGRDGQWYNAGDIEFLAEGMDWSYSHKLDNHHVTVLENTDSKLSVVLDYGDGYSYRSYRDYYFDGNGCLTQIEMTNYTKVAGRLYGHHGVLEFHATARDTLDSRLNEIVTNAAGRDYEDYDQLMREDGYHTDYALGAGQFLWRFGGWGFYTGGEDATATGMTVRHECVENPTKGSVYTDGAYWLERLEEGRWNRVPMIPGGAMPSGDAKLIFDNIHNLMAPTYMKVDWGDTYGGLTPGFYRFAQSYSLKTTDGRETIHTCYAKFRVYDPETTENVELCRRGLQDLMDRENYQIIANDYNQEFLERGEPNHMESVVWKRGGDYMERTSYLDHDSVRGYMLISGAGYSVYWEGGDVTSDIVDWEKGDWIEPDTFEIWSFPYTWYDAYITSATRTGNEIFIREEHGEDSYVLETVCAFDNDGNLTSIRMLRNGKLDKELVVADITREQLDMVFASQDVTRPVSFDYAADEANFQYFTNRKTGGFANTSPVTISTAQEAIERAKNDCTLPVAEDENGYHEGGWNMTKAFFDESAKMWKVEFTFSQGGVYQAVYMTADGITTCVID